MPGGGGENASGSEATPSIAVPKGLILNSSKSLKCNSDLTSRQLERFLTMVWKYLHFDFGDSYFKGRSVISLIVEKMPVSISLGLWLTLVSFLVSIPLGIRKAVKDGSRFDIWTSAVVIVGYAIPNFIFAIFLIVVVCWRQLL